MSISDHVADVSQKAEAPESPAKRPRGRPKGHPKSGGRQPASSNWTAQATREKLLPKAAMLAERILDGRPIRSGKVWVYPTVSESLRAAEMVLQRTLPTLAATELTGKDGSPLNPEPASTDSRDLARAILGVLREAQTEGPDTPAPRPAPKPRVTDAPETIVAMFNDPDLAVRMGAVAMDAPSPAFEVGHIEHFEHSWICLEQPGRWEVYRKPSKQNIGFTRTYGEAAAWGKSVVPVGSRP